MRCASGRLQPLADEVVDGSEQQRPVARELLRRVLASARRHDGREIVGAEMALDELARALPDDRRAERGHVEIVEHDDVDAAGRDVAIRSHVGLDTVLPASRKESERSTGSSMNENVSTFCGLPSSRISKSSRVRPVTKLPRCVGDGDVDVHEIDAHLERRALWRFGRLRAQDRGGGQQRDEDGAAHRLFWIGCFGSKSDGFTSRYFSAHGDTKSIDRVIESILLSTFQFISLPEDPWAERMLARAALFTHAVCSERGHEAAAQNVYGSLVGNVTDSSGGAVPGATVTATQTQTNLTREVVTNESGAYSIPNIPSGTYQVVVAVPGFQNFTVRDIVVTNRDVRVDARLSLGALEEAVTVTATAAILQTENAAVQHVADSEQLQTLPTSGRAFQSFMTLMPGVADPNYEQSGGINNPGPHDVADRQRQPATNTVVRLDGITATNQFFESIQSYGPSLEAIETVNVVTSSFDADQGMAGAAAVNVQVKTGTNNFHGIGVRIRGRRTDALAQLLPAGGPRQGHVERARVRRDARRADPPQQAVLFLQR